MAEFFLLRLNNMPLYIITTFSLSTHLSIDSCVVSTFWLLWMMPQWTQESRHLFEIYIIFRPLYKTQEPLYYFIFSQFFSHLSIHFIFLLFYFILFFYQLDIGVVWAMQYISHWACKVIFLTINSFSLVKHFVGVIFLWVFHKCSSSF